MRAAFVFLLVGYGTKAGLAPMHNWLPDAHSQAPAPGVGPVLGLHAEQRPLLHPALPADRRRRHRRARLAAGAAGGVRARLAARRRRLHPVPARRQAPAGLLQRRAHRAHRGRRRPRRRRAPSPPSFHTLNHSLAKSLAFLERRPAGPGLRQPRHRAHERCLPRLARVGRRPRRRLRRPHGRGPVRHLPERAADPAQRPSTPGAACCSWRSWSAWPSPSSGLLRHTIRLAWARSDAAPRPAARPPARAPARGERRSSLLLGLGLGWPEPLLELPSRTRRASWTADAGDRSRSWCRDATAGGSANGGQPAAIGAAARSASAGVPGTATSERSGAAARAWPPSSACPRSASAGSDSRRAAPRRAPGSRADRSPARCCRRSSRTATRRSRRAFPQLHRFEREMLEQWGVVPEGHPWLKPVRFQKPLPRPGGRGRRSRPTIGVTDFFRVGGDEIHEVAVGPVHAGIIEPGHFRFQCHGEHVYHLEISLGYQHRGVERALVGGPDAALPPLRRDARRRHQHRPRHRLLPGASRPWPAARLPEAGLARARARARAGAPGQPHRATWAPWPATSAFLPTASYCGRIRGDFLNLTALLCGNRFGRGLVVPGGVAFACEPGSARPRSWSG